MPTTRHKLVSTVALLACVGNTIGSGNNVCESINDYFNLSVNPRCWENPDVWSNPVMYIIWKMWLSGSTVVVPKIASLKKSSMKVS